MSSTKQNIAVIKYAASLRPHSQKAEELMASSWTSGKGGKVSFRLGALRWDKTEEVGNSVWCVCVCDTCVLHMSASAPCVKSFPVVVCFLQPVCFIDPCLFCTLTFPLCDCGRFSWIFVLLRCFGRPFFHLSGFCPLGVSPLVNLPSPPFFHPPSLCLYGEVVLCASCQPSSF